MLPETERKMNLLYTDRELVEWHVRAGLIGPPEFFDSGAWDIWQTDEELALMREETAAFQLSQHGYGLEELPNIPHKVGSPSRVRRAAGVRGYFGLNGSGKSYCAVYDLIPVLNGIKWRCYKEGHFHSKLGVYEGYQRVLSTVKLLDPRNNRPHPLFVPYDDHRRLLHFEHGSVLMDEAQGVASAGDYASMPTQVRNVFSQFRRRELEIIYTCIEWGKALKDLRDITRLVTYCKGSFPVPEKGRVWASNSYFSWKTYHAEDIDKFDAGTRKRLIPMTFQGHFRPSKKHHVQYLYDSFDEVLSTGGTTENGMCLHCGGKRSVTACKCVRHEVDSAENLMKLGADFSDLSFKEDTDLGAVQALLEPPKRLSIQKG